MKSCSFQIQFKNWLTIFQSNREEIKTKQNKTHKGNFNAVITIACVTEFNCQNKRAWFITLEVSFESF